MDVTNPSNISSRLRRVSFGGSILSRQQSWSFGVSRTHRTPWRKYNSGDGSDRMVRRRLKYEEHLAYVALGIVAITPQCTNVSSNDKNIIRNIYRRWIFFYTCLCNDALSNDLIFIVFNLYSRPKRNIFHDIIAHCDLFYSIFLSFFRFIISLPPLLALFASKRIVPLGTREHFYRTLYISFVPITGSAYVQLYTS